MQIVTDSKTVEEPKDPETCNVFAIFKQFASPEQLEELTSAYLKGGLGYGHAKQALYGLLEEHFSGPREKYNELMDNLKNSNPGESQLDKFLSEGAKQARKIATDQLQSIKDNCLGSVSPVTTGKQPTKTSSVS